MAITSGYFNSVNGDRKYNADQMSEYFEGIINEGVCQHIGGGLAVTAGTGLTVSVATGKAFIGQKWIKNDAALTLTITTAADQARIDAVVLRRNTTNRVCEIAVKTGTPSASPSAPAMTRTSTTYEMALAYVNVAAGATSVTVTDKRSDSSVCGWATVAQATSGEVDQMLQDMKTGFDGVEYPSPVAMVQGCDTLLQNGIDAIYQTISVNDIFGNNTTIAGKDSKVTASWDSTTKTITVTLTSTGTSADSYYVIIAPKTQAGHTYKIAIKYNYSSEYSYTYIRNIFSLSNYNNRDDIVNGVAKYNNTEEVLNFTATNDGWIALAKRVGANVTDTWGFKIAMYDVTGHGDLPDAPFLSFADAVSIGSSGVVADIIPKVDFMYNMTKNPTEEKWSALGDSLTAQGSGSQYLGYVSDRLKLANYYNCGIGGTTISGATNANAMYQDVRINALNINSQCVTVMGGTNDAWQEYYKDHPNDNMTGWGDCDRTNHDVLTFCGAYNVLISKVLYKFCKIPAYYNDVDYTGITQVETAINNFRLILITNPQAFHVDGDSMSANLQIKGLTAAHSYIKQIAELWGLPCVDSWEMGMNDINRPLFFANYLLDATHFNSFGHERLASLIIDKALQISRYN